MKHSFENRYKEKVWDEEITPSESAFEKIYFKTSFSNKKEKLRRNRQMRASLLLMIFLVSIVYISQNVKSPTNFSFDEQNLNVKDDNASNPDFQVSKSRNSTSILENSSKIHFKNQTIGALNRLVPKLVSMNQINPISRNKLNGIIIDNKIALAKSISLDNMDPKSTNQGKNLLEKLPIISNANIETSFPTILKSFASNPELKTNNHYISLEVEQGFSGGFYRSKLVNIPLKSALDLLNQNGFNEFQKSYKIGYEYRPFSKKMSFVAGLQYSEQKVEILKYEIEAAFVATNNPLFRSQGKIEDGSKVISKTFVMPLELKYYIFDRSRLKSFVQTGGFVSYNADNVFNLWNSKSTQTSYLSNPGDFRTFNFGAQAGLGLAFDINKYLSLQTHINTGINFASTYTSSYLYKQNRYFGSAGIGIKCRI